MNVTVMNKFKVLKGKGAQAFLINFFISFLVFIPFMIRDHGILTIFDDFNKQQIPIMMLANEAVKSGNILWNWNIDIGSSFIGGTSFYNSGSPFFFLTLLVSKNTIPYIIGWLYMLKYAVAGLFSFSYIERYCEDKRYAIIGSVLYAFSGFQSANLIFHFHDVVALFPLLLIGLDKLVLDKKKGFLAFAVFLSALLNFYFLIAEIVFLIIYFLVRYPKQYWNKVFLCMWEGILGIIMAMIVFLPTIAFNFMNPRISVFLQVEKWFDFNRRYLLYLIRSFLLPSEMMSKQSFISEQDFSSWSAYLPMVGIILVCSFVLKSYKTWIAKLIIVLSVFCIVPLLNSIFSLCTETNYHRWYFMLILIMSLASSIVMEKRKQYPVALISVFFLMFTVILTFASFWWDKNKFKLIYMQDKFIWVITTAIVGMIFVLLFHKFVRKDNHYFYFMLVGISLFACFTTITNLKEYKNLAKLSGTPGNEGGMAYYDRILALEELKQDNAYRYESDDNIMSMAAGVKGTGSFYTTVNGSIFEFYESLLDERSTFTPNGQEGVKELLSAKYYVTQTRQETTPVQTVKRGGKVYYVYENEISVPIGYTYETYMLYSDYEKLDYAHRGLCMLKTLIVRDESEKEVVDILKKYDSKVDGDFEITDKDQMVKDHQKESSSDFRIQKNKFTSIITADCTKFAFYSVPYDKGWSAKVNGNEVSILNVNGLMAVPVSKGENQIIFTYENSYLLTGAVLSVIGFLIYFVYRKERRGKKEA